MEMKEQAKITKNTKQTDCQKKVTMPDIQMTHLPTPSPPSDPIVHFFFY